MSCSEIQPLLALRSLAELEDEESALVASHLGACSSCRDEMGELDAALELAKAPSPPLAGRRADAKEAIWDRIAPLIDEKPGETTSSEETLPRVSIALACCFCKGALARAEACYCASCLAPHHDDCWRAHGRCSALGCEETRTVRPRENEAPRPAAARARTSRIVTGIFLLGGLGAAALVGTTFLAAPAAIETAQPSEPRMKKTVSKPESDLAEHEASSTSAAAPVDVTVEAVNLRDAVAEIGRKAGKNIIVMPDIDEKTTISLRSVPWRDAVAAVAKTAGCAVKPIGDEVLAVIRPPAATIHLERANLRLVVQLLANFTNKNVVISPQCPAVELTTDFHEVDWLDALRAIMRSYGVHAVMQGDIVVVLPGPGPDVAFGAGEPPLLWPFSREGEGDGPRVDLSFSEAPLGEVCASIGKKIGVPVVAEASDLKISIELRAAPWRDALLAVAHLAWRHLEKRGATYVLSRHPRGSLQACDADGHIWLELLASYAGKSLVVSPDVGGTLTVDLHDVPYADAFKASALAADLEVAEVEGGVLAVKTRASAGTAYRVAIYDVRDILAGMDPEKIIEVVKDSTGREEAWGEPATAELHAGQLIIKQDAKVHEAIRAALAKLRRDARAARHIEPGLELVALVVDERPQGKSRAVIEYDGVSRIYGVGDEIRDPDDHRVEGVKVLEVVESAVKLKRGNAEVLIPLRPAR